MIAMKPQQWRNNLNLAVKLLRSLCFRRWHIKALCALSVVALIGCDARPVATTSTKPQASVGASERVESLYNKSCIACHASGAAGAPRTGDVMLWQARLDEVGIEALVDIALQGKGSMPAKGFCAECEREDLAALIRFMAAER